MTKYDLIELIAKRLAMVDGINLEAADPTYDIGLANFGLDPVASSGRKPTDVEIRHYYMAAMITITTYLG